MSKCRDHARQDRIRSMLVRVFALRGGTNRRWWELQSDEQFWKDVEDALGLAPLDLFGTGVAVAEKAEAV